MRTAIAIVALWVAFIALAALFIAVHSNGELQGKVRAYRNNAVMDVLDCTKERR